MPKCQDRKEQKVYLKATSGYAVDPYLVIMCGVLYIYFSLGIPDALFLVSFTSNQYFINLNCEIKKIHIFACFMLIHVYVTMTKYLGYSLKLGQF